MFGFGQLIEVLKKSPKKIVFTAPDKEKNILQIPGIINTMKHIIC